MKNACYRAVISNRKVIGNANDVYEFCQEGLNMEVYDEKQKTVSRRELIFIDKVERNRPETNVQKLTGTRKLHSDMSTSSDMISVQEI